MYKSYKKENSFSYAMGLFPVIELLTQQPQYATEILISDKIKPSVGLEKIRVLCAQHNVPMTDVPHANITRLARTDNMFAVGVFRKQSANLAADKAHVVLVNPDDMGNLGTIMRTMLGFDAKDLAIITPAADAYDPKTIRASMGAQFSLRVAHFKTFEDYQAAFSAHHAYTFVLNGTQKLAHTTFAQPASLIFGQEGSGLPSSFEQVGTTVTIEQSQAVDSLNLAMSVGVALYRRFTQEPTS